MNTSKLILPYLNNKVFKLFGSTADEMGIEVFVVGGFIRDLFLKRKTKDIDIVVTGKGVEYARVVAAKLKHEHSLNVFENFGTAQLKYKGMEYEFVGARKESYRRNSRNPIVEEGSLEDDQNRRDFTINALMVSLNSENFGQLIDPFDGLKDLENKIIKTPLRPSRTFDDDPLRMMRAIRFAAQLDFRIEEDTFDAIKDISSRISIVSKERINDELNKMIMTDQPSTPFKMMDQTGLLKNIFPQFLELKGTETRKGISHKDNFYHTLQVLDNLCQTTDNLWLRWAAILHDIAKPATKQFHDGLGWTFHGHEYIGSKMTKGIFRKMKLPMNEKMKFVQKMVLLHLRPMALVEEKVTDSAVRRLLFEAGDDIDSLMKLCKADITSKNQRKVKRYLQNFENLENKLVEIEEKDKIRNWQPPISGELIMKTFGLKPCKKVGDIKNEIREAILEGDLDNNYDDAFDYMLEIAKNKGLSPVDS